MSVSIKEVAKKSKVSLATVSRVLNNESIVKPETVKKVRKAIEQLGYRQNILASNLRKKHTTYIGLIVPSITYEFFSYLARHIEFFLQKEGFSLFLCNSDEDYEKEEFYLRSLTDNQVSGIIMVSADIEKSARQVDMLDIPVILIDRFNPTVGLQKNVVCIQSDHYMGGKMAGEQLVLSGADRFAFLRTTKRTYPQQLREEGFVTSMNHHKIPKSKYGIFHSDPNPDIVAKRVIEIFGEFPFNGIFCGNDRIAYGVISSLIRHKIRIPQQVQVIGYDDIEMGRFFVPAISTIRQDVLKLAEVAASKMISMIRDGNQLSEFISIPTGFIKRETTK